jgi:glycosyltransferase involved in cell wall biosynthesis
LFNAADLYISPYLAEGFNLTVLEALSAGLPVLVPETGSTREYINDIKEKSKEYIFHVKSNVVQTENGMKQNNINTSDLVYLLQNIENDLHTMKVDRYKNYLNLQKSIEEKYSWSKVADLLLEYIQDILKQSE